MTRRRRLILIAAGAATALLLALVAVWWFVLRSNAPPPVSLDEAIAAVTSTSGAGAEPGTIEGEWVTVAGNGSFAGYRVDEQLATIGFTTAAGRSTDLTATLTIAADTVTAVDVVVNMRALTSDESRRDGAIRDQAIETDRFPQSRFTLAEPISLPGGADSGAAFTVTALGDLELHGVTQRVSIEMSAQMVDGVIAVVGSTEIAFADYDIDPPRSMAVLSVDDHGLMEFQLLFARA